MYNTGDAINYRKEKKCYILICLALTKCMATFNQPTCSFILAVDHFIIGAQLNL